MECLKEKIENLYLELSYVRLEWELMKEIDKKTNCSDEKIIKKNEELILTLKDSLWYAIIMRLAKICEDDTQVNSIYKIFNCCSTNPIVVRKKIISEKELLEKIEAINYDDKLTEINENILKSQEEYTKMIEEINNKNKPEEKPSNIISFESLKKKRKANKKVFSINEDIMSDELETSSAYVIDLNSESFGIMAN